MWTSCSRSSRWRPRPRASQRHASPMSLWSVEYVTRPSSRTSDTPRISAETRCVAEELRRASLGASRRQDAAKSRASTSRCRSVASRGSPAASPTDLGLRDREAPDDNEDQRGRERQRRRRARARSAARAAAAVRSRRALGRSVRAAATALISVSASRRSHRRGGRPLSASDRRHRIFERDRPVREEPPVTAGTTGGSWGRQVAEAAELARRRRWRDDRRRSMAQEAAATAAAYGDRAPCRARSRAASRPLPSVFPPSLEVGSAVSVARGARRRAAAWASSVHPSAAGWTGADAGSARAAVLRVRRASDEPSCTEGSRRASDSPRDGLSGRRGSRRASARMRERRGALRSTRALDEREERSESALCELRERHGQAAEREERHRDAHQQREQQAAVGVAGQPPRPCRSSDIAARVRSRS